MGNFTEDVLRVNKMLPWIKNGEVLKFMRKIPLDKSHLRSQLALRYFLKTRDGETDFQDFIEDEAKEIVSILPDVPYKKIKRKLNALGCLENRKEIVLRELLIKRGDLDEILGELNFDVKKRKSDSSNGLFPFEFVEDMTVSPKIPRLDKLDGPSTLKESSASYDIGWSIEELPTSSTSATSNINNLPNSISNGTFPSATITTADSLQEPPKISVPSSWTEFCMPEPVMLTRRKSSEEGNDVHPKIFTYPTETNSIACNPGGTNADSKREIFSADTSSNKTNSAKESNFNLVSYLKEFSSAPEQRIYNICESLGLNLNERPNENTLIILINHLLDGAVKTRSFESISSFIKNENPPDEVSGHLLLSVPDCRKHKIKNRQVDKSLMVGNCREKTFKLREPVLKIASQTTNNFSSVPSQQVVISPSSPIIQPARFNPRNFGEITSTTVAPKQTLNPKIVVEPTHFVEEQVITLGSREVAQVLKDSDSFVNEHTGSSDVPQNLTINECTETLMEIEENLVPSSSNCIIETKKRVLNEKLVLGLIEMFPQACPEYIRDICDGKKLTQLDELVTVVLSEPDYPKRPERPVSPPKEVDPEEQFAIIRELLPNADPTYIRMQCDKFANDDIGLKEFVNHAMETADYPTMKEYLRKQQLSAQQKQYTTEFSIENFIQLFPDPEKTFNDPNRSVQLDPFSVHYMNLFFKNRFERIPTRTIQQVMVQNDCKVMTCEKIFTAAVQRKEVMKTKRKPTPLPENMQNIPLLQELAYLTHRVEIQAYLLDKQKREEQERIEAKENGLMETCQCCYDDEVMPKDCFSCPNGCKFCRDCIKKSCEVALGEGKTNFFCLADCTTEFTLQTLQSVLLPKMFSKLAQKKALAEIKAAGIEELETCPFCDFASIPNETDKIFRCLNPDCMKESCRNCKEPNHVPLKCNEVEKDADVQARTYVENKMTEALLRKCWKCGTSFFKEEGCNKMTCTCGASMCYICKKPVKDYNHFNGLGGDKYKRCPLYSNTNLQNKTDVLGAAMAAKAEVGPNLKIDPTVDVEDHYRKRAKKLPREPHLDLLGDIPQPYGMMGHHYQHRPPNNRRRHGHPLAPRQRRHLEFMMQRWQF